MHKGNIYCNNGLSCLAFVHLEIKYHTSIVHIIGCVGIVGITGESRSRRNDDYPL